MWHNRKISKATVSLTIFTQIVLREWAIKIDVLSKSPELVSSSSGSDKMASKTLTTTGIATFTCSNGLLWRASKAGIKEK